MVDLKIECNGQNIPLDKMAMEICKFNDCAERLRITSDGLVKIGGNETVSAATGIQIEMSGQHF